MFYLGAGLVVTSIVLWRKERALRLAVTEEAPLA